MGEATTTPLTTLKTLHAPAGVVGESVHTATVAQVLYQSKLYGKATVEKYPVQSLQQFQKL